MGDAMIEVRRYVFPLRDGQPVVTHLHECVVDGKSRYVGSMPRCRAFATIYAPALVGHAGTQEPVSVTPPLESVQCEASSQVRLESGAIEKASASSEYG